MTVLEELEKKISDCLELALAKEEKPQDAVNHLRVWYDALPQEKKDELKNTFREDVLSLQVKFRGLVELFTQELPHMVI